MTTQESLFSAQSLPGTTSLQAERREREEALKREARRRHKKDRRDWLDRMERQLVLIYEGRVAEWGEGEAYVTADDGRHLMATYPKRYELPAGATNNIMGGLFMGQDWEPVDRDARGRALATHVSSTKGARGNRIVRWRYVGQSQRQALSA